MEVFYRRKENGPYMEFVRDDGKKVKLWNTFFQEQVDIDPYSAATQEYYERNLGDCKTRTDHPLRCLRIRIKAPGHLLLLCRARDMGRAQHRDEAAPGGATEMLPEIHENYCIQLKMAERGTGSTISRCQCCCCTD